MHVYQQQTHQLYTLNWHALVIESILGMYNHQLSINYPYEEGNMTIFYQEPSIYIAIFYQEPSIYIAIFS